MHRRCDCPHSLLPALVCLKDASLESARSPKEQAIVSPPVSGNESARLKALAEYQILDTPPESSLDGLAMLAAHILGVQIAVISFAAADRQWLKAHYGWPNSQAALAGSFCQCVVAANAPLVIPDARCDARFADHPGVRGEPYIRFYAGVPLRTPAGLVLGALCCASDKAHQVDPKQIEMLILLAKQVEELLELRKQRLEAAAVSAQHASETGALLAMLDRVPATVGYWNRDLINVYANAKYQDFYGCDAKTLRGQHLREFLLAHQLDGNMSRAHAVLEQGTPQAFEVALTNSAGTEIEIHVDYVPDVQGTDVVGLIVLATDITARNRAARELLRNQQTSRAVLDALPGSVLHLSPDGYMSAIYGRTDKGLLLHGGEPPYRHWSEHFTEAAKTQLSPQFEASIAKASQHQRVERIEFCVPTDVKVCHYEAQLIRVPCSSNLVCIILDITEKRQQEQSLRDYSERLSALIKAAPDGILMLSEEGRIEQASPMMERICGYRESELLSKPIQSLVATATWKQTDTSEGAPPPDPRVTLWHDAAVVRKDGTEVLAEISISDFELNGRRRAIAIVRDISERELMRARSQFVALVSHELRAPLNTVIGLGEALLEEPKEAMTALQRERVATMLHSGQHLSALVTDILDLSRIELGMLRLDLREQQVDPICDRTVTIISDASERKQIALRKQYEHGDVLVLADARRVTQILINLLDNAIKFTPQGGEVTLRTRCRGSSVELAVQDNGIGITESERHQLFRPFSQIDSRTSRNYPGTGLGLYLARRLALLHGGDIACQSLPGIGSTFTLSIPLHVYSDEPRHG